jgi:hypothetical protein
VELNSSEEITKFINENKNTKQTKFIPKKTKASLSRSDSGSSNSSNGFTPNTFLPRPIVIK